MEKENTQKELFKFDSPKKHPEGFRRFFQKTDLILSLSAEKLVFVSIGIVMLIVVSFALGVERGKAISSTNTESRTSQTLPAKEAEQARAVNTVTNITPKERVQAAAVKSPAQAQKQANKDKSYTIVAGAFTKKSSADQEASRLKVSGLEAFVYYSEPYYLACVGSFANKESAEKILGKVKQMHRDAYVRMR